MKILENWNELTTFRKIMFVGILVVLALMVIFVAGYGWLWHGWPWQWF